MKKGLHLSKLAYTLLLSSLFSFSTNAQIDLGNTREGEAVEYCKTHKHLKEKLQNPAFYQQYVQEQQEMLNIEQQMKANPNQTRAVYYIPIVFHILHTGGSENISDEQIMDQLAILNRDFRLLNNDANNVQYEFNASNPSHVCQPADIEVEFRLATKAPDGTCFNGITRTYSAATSNGDDGDAQVNAIKQGNDIYKGEWPGNKYLNVFIVSDAGGAAGYTMKPSSWVGAGMNNGIWILHNYIGSIGTGNAQTSRALTHEIGHWLNLDHTWGGTNNPGIASNCSTDDGVADTPNTIGVTSCKLNENSCGPKANVENYMDYSYCSKMFTEGQRDRMRAALESTIGGRKNVVSSSNLVSVGADGNAVICKAAFEASSQLVCKGSTITFTDKSYNNVASRFWEFQGGTPATSTAKNPEITYSTPGVYPVKLTVSDGTNSLTETQTAYIVVMNDAIALPYFEGFENYNATSDMTTYQIINHDASSKAWELTSNAAKTGSKSIYINNYSQNAGNVDEFISPNIDLSDVTTGNGGVTLSFRYAIAKKSSSQESELLKTYISNNCGESYVLRKTLTGTSLTSDVVASNWTPSASDWKTVHVTNITSSYFVENFRFKFAFESKGGNNIFIDDINLYSGDPSDENVLSTNTIPSSNFSGVTIYPNPATSELNVSYNALVGGKNTIQVVDMVGKVIMNYEINANEGLNEVLIDTQNLGNGVYFVKVGDRTNAKTLQFIKQ